MRREKCHQLPHSREFVTWLGSWCVLEPLFRGVSFRRLNFTLPGWFLGLNYAGKNDKVPANEVCIVLSLSLSLSLSCTVKFLLSPGNLFS